MINSLEPTPAARVADPQRMIRAYANASSAMNMLRAYLGGGMADLQGVHDWNKGFVTTSRAGERYETIPGSLADLSARTSGGCAFAPRCAERFAPCETREPALYPFGEGRARKQDGVVVGEVAAVVFEQHEVEHRRVLGASVRLRRHRSFARCSRSRRRIST